MSKRFDQRREFQMFCLELMIRPFERQRFQRLISAEFELQNYDNAVKVFAKVYVSERLGLQV